jgi:hypothetical protein
MLFISRAALIGLLKSPPDAADGLGTPLRLAAPLGTVGVNSGTPLGMVWSAGLDVGKPAVPTPDAPTPDAPTPDAPTPDAPTPGVPKLVNPPPTPCAETSGEANHPTPPTIATQINLRDIGPIEASLFRLRQFLRIILPDFDGDRRPGTLKSAQPCDALHSLLAQNPDNSWFPQILWSTVCG